MMKRRHAYKAGCKTLLVIGLLVWLVPGTWAQISPGQLTTAHAQLEGISNCTKCHVLGDKVTNAKCLDCHKEINSRMEQRKGYHASSEVAGKDCFTCHSEHHGKNFEIVRFDEERFNHALTGYKLTGAHLQQDCKACHNDERIESAELRNKKTTYLGLRTECIACHRDIHQKTLSTNCASCHTTESFIPAALFDHAKTDFPLKGKHKTVDCKSCHQVTVSNGQLFQQFAGRPFASCADCHTDVHDNRFGRNCKDCHTEESFNVFIGNNKFNHNQTEFPLKGKHKTVDCASCHDLGKNVVAENVFRDYKGKDFHNCAACHKDVHESRFGTDCRKCHTEDSFHKLLNADQFDHSLTGFPLEGRHNLVDCRKCHETNLTEPLAHNACVDCHDDFHKGQFAGRDHNPDCKECHSVNGFAGSLYTIEQHNASAFPLTGAHLATPCNACHMKDDEWSFRDVGMQCVDCHTNVHDGHLGEKYYPDKNCTECHITDAWAEVTFDHAATEFELSGRHAMISCTACHQPVTTSARERKIPFNSLQNECAKCHENAHGDQFAVAGVTDCVRCHGSLVWKPSLFDHDTARFVLDGAHKNVSCNECHQADIPENGKQIVLYRTNKLQCIDCHM